MASMKNMAKSGAMGSAGTSGTPARFAPIRKHDPDREVRFVPVISGGVFEAFKIVIIDCGATYESKTLTGLDCPAEFTGITRLSAYMECLEFTTHRGNFTTSRSDDDSKMVASFHYIPDIDVYYAD